MPALRGTASSSKQARPLAVLLGLAGSASLGLTMMACYGAPPCEPGTPGCTDHDAASATSSKGTPVDGGASPAP